VLQKKRIDILNTYTSWEHILTLRKLPFCRSGNFQGANIRFYLILANVVIVIILLSVEWSFNAQNIQHALGSKLPFSKRTVNELRFVLTVFKGIG